MLHVRASRNTQPLSLYPSGRPGSGGAWILNNRIEPFCKVSAKPQCHKRWSSLECAKLRCSQRWFTFHILLLKNNNYRICSGQLDQAPPDSLINKGTPKPSVIVESYELQSLWTSQDLASFEIENLLDSPLPRWEAKIWAQASRVFQNSPFFCSSNFFVSSTCNGGYPSNFKKIFGFSRTNLNSLCQNVCSHLVKRWWTFFF